MKPKVHCLSLLIALASLPTAGAVADEAAPAPAANVQVQVQGGAQVQIQLGAGNVRVVGNAAAPAEDARPRLAEPPAILFPIFPFHPLPHLTFEKVGKPGYLGVQLEMTPEEEGEVADPKEKKNQGAGILAVLDGSPAERAGVKEGDRVLTIEGKAVKDSTQLRVLIRAAKADQIVKLTVRRDGKEIELKAKLGAFPEEEAIVQLAAQNAPAAVPGIVVFNRNANLAVRSSTSATGSASKAAAGDMDAVSLRDGNRFVGRIQRIDPAKGVILHREVGPELELIEAGISSLTFADREKTPPPTSNVSLQLRDGSCFSGDALAMERGKILLTLPGGQRLELPREHALSATLSAGQSAQIYEGPMSLTGWSPTRSGQTGNWDYKDGFLRCINNGPIGRNFERMPDPLDLSFDVLYPPSLHHFGISLFSNASNQTTAGAATIQFSPNQISGNHFDGKRYNQYNANLPRAEPPNTEEPTSRRYRLLVDRVNGRVLIYVDGVKRADWNISKVKPEDIGKCGANFSISPNVFTSNANFQVGRIHVLPWDGKEPADGTEPVRPKADQVLPAHGPAIVGTIERITGRDILFRNAGQSVPRDETVHVRFATPSTPPAELLPAVALVRMKNGSEFAVAKLTGDGHSMSLTTRFGSQISLPLSALRDLEFLPRPGDPDASITGADVLTLHDGTQLKGTLIAPIAGGNLRWKIAASKLPLEFPETGVAGVLFSRAKDASPLRGAAAVRLGNGDWLPGDVVSLDENRLVLKNDLAPELVFPLTALRSVFLSPEVTAAVADGATGPDLWSKGWNPTRTAMTRQQLEVASKMEEPWAYHDGAYTLKNAARIGSALLARRWTAYPGAYALNFEVENPGRTASFNMQLFNSKDERTFTVYSFGSRVNVYFNPNSTKLNRLLGGAKRFQADEQIKSDGRNLRVSLVMDRPAKTFRLFMNGKEIGKIPFKEAEANEALDVGGMSLTPMASGLTGGRQSRITNIWFAPWEGPPAVTADPVERQKAAGPGAGIDAAPLPTVHLANGDEFAGKIEGLNADLLIVDSEAGLLELPRERLAWLSFPGAPAIPSAQLPRLRFHDRGTLSIKDLEIENGRVRCQTLHGEALDFPLSLVKEIVYRAVIQK